MDVKIDYKGEEINFKSNMGLTLFNDIKEKYRKKTNKSPMIAKPNWWYEKSDFGLFFIKELYNRTSIDSVIEINTKAEWWVFYPLFKHYFPTIAEYGAIKNNVAFWNSQATHIIEDGYFVKWVVLNQYGYVDYKSMCDIPFKEMMMMYYYGILGRIFSQADKFKEIMYREMLQENEEQPEMFR